MLLTLFVLVRNSDYKENKRFFEESSHQNLIHPMNVKEQTKTFASFRFCLCFLLTYRVLCPTPYGISSCTLGTNDISLRALIIPLKLIFQISYIWET